MISCCVCPPLRVGGGGWGGYLGGTTEGWDWIRIGLVWFGLDWIWMARECPCNHEKDTPLLYQNGCQWDLKEENDASMLAACGILLFYYSLGDRE